MVSSSPTFLLYHYSSFSILITIIMFGVTCESKKVENIIEQYPWNRQLVDSIQDPYEIVYPVQVRDRVRLGIDTRNYMLLNGSRHFPHVTIVIRSSSGRLKLNLELNRVLLPEGAVFDTEAIYGHSSSSVVNCYYQGRVQGDDASSVALSTCSGLRGVIFTGNDTYAVVALLGGDRGKRHPHLLIKTRWNSKSSCANGDNSDWAASSRHERDVDKMTKFIEVALVADYEMVKKFDSYSQLVRYSFETINIADLFYKRDLNARLSIVYLEAWTNGSRVKTDPNGDLTRTLLNLLEYTSVQLHDRHKDLVLVLTSIPFARNQVTMATTGTICTAKAVGVVRSTDHFLPHETATIVAHNIGHLLGMRHSYRQCRCNTKRCLMNEEIGVPNRPFSARFSSCSRTDFAVDLRTKRLRCLYNEPLKVDLLQQCGNGLVDPDEDCDCGSSANCDDLCCDPITCKLKAEAQCSSEAVCCDSHCQVVPSGRMCRPAIDRCDVPEMCTGIHGLCPEDSVKVDGSECGPNKHGHCWQGKCADLDVQCGTIWGPAARVADSRCFTQMNVLGSEHGHCGPNQDSSFIPCAVSDSHCGLLQCRNGSVFPIDQNSASFTSQFSVNGQRFECKSAVSSKGMVSNGAKCRKDAYCLDGVCTSMSLSAIDYCPTNNLAFACSGHGDCTTSSVCFCHPGWTDKACDEPIPITSIESTSRPTSEFDFRTSYSNPFDFSSSNLNTAALLVILSVVGISILIFLLCILLCYRRRTSSELYKKKLAERDAERKSESSVDDARRSIKFGNMPSYRDEKRKRRKDKRIYDALQRITEASDERDSVSTHSRGSRHDCLSDRGSVRTGPDCPPSPRSVSSVVHPPSSCPRRLLEHSLRQLDEYQPSPRSHRRRVCSPAKSDFIRASPRCNHELAVFSRDYATDTELGVCTSPTSSVLDISVGDKDVLSGHRLGMNDHRMGSPTSSMVANIRLGQPAPLQLRNIEYLLKQLKTEPMMNGDEDLAEMSPIEADRNEQCSNTESNRDELGGPVRITPSYYHYDKNRYGHHYEQDA